jgi:DNA ligase 1
VVVILNKLLYKKTQTGAIQTWQIFVDKDKYYTIEGQLDGKLTTSVPKKAEGKNIGKANETSAEEQAIKEAQAKWDKKVEKGYTPDITKVNTSKKFFEPMLAQKYNDYKDKLEFPLLVSPKIDGCRMVATSKGLFTRNGKEYVSCPHIIEELKPIFNKHPTWIIDGEIYAHEIDFQKIISLVKKQKPDKEDFKESEKVIKYWIFDGVVDNQQEPFKDRFKIIKNEINNLIPNHPHLIFVENEEINSHAEIETYHNDYVSKGFEGIMIRVPDSPYETKRSKTLLKYKHFVDEEFEILNIVEGKGNRSGMAGNLELLMKNGKTFASGIKGGEEYYKQLLKDKNKYIKKLATIRYQNLSEDGIPRFPVAVNLDPIDR